MASYNHETISWFLFIEVDPICLVYFVSKNSGNCTNCP